MIFCRNFLHLKNKCMFPIKLSRENLFFFNSTLSNNIIKQFLEFATINCSILIIITNLEYVFNGLHCNINSNFFKSSLHLRFSDSIGSIHINDLKGFFYTDIGLFNRLKQPIKSFFLFVSCKYSTSSKFSQELFISYWLATIQVEFSK
jgi:hypothetical protein